MKQLFYIDNKAENTEQKSLALQVSERNLCYAITDQSGSMLFELAYCYSEEAPVNAWNEKELSDFFYSYPSLSGSFQNVGVSFDFPPNIFLPKDEDECFFISSEIRNFLAGKFPLLHVHHHSRVLLKKLQSKTGGDQLFVDFRRNDFSIIAIDGDKFLFAQQFEYTVPADVLFYLLKTCRHFEFQQETVILYISGLLEKQSVLYRDLYQYFVNIIFRDATWEGNTGYPLHFFTSLNDLAICES